MKTLSVSAAESQSAGAKRFPANELAGRVKASFFWQIFVRSATPVFEFFWEYLVHFKDKAMYWASPFRGKASPALRDRAIEIYRNDSEFTGFAKWLKSRIPAELLDEKRAELLARNDIYAFNDNLDFGLDDETKLKIVEFALSDKVLKLVLPYFKMVPRVDTVFTMFNIPRPELGAPAGSQLWHRDGDIYKMLSLYVCITDLDEKSGIYSAIGEENLTYHQAIPLEFIDPNLPIWKNGRHSDQYMRKFVPDERVTRLEGPVGTAALVDSASCYHKGGFCKTGERILFQINYIADQSHEKGSVLEYLKLEKHPGIKAIINTPLKERMMSANNHKRGKRVFTVARRLLTYNLNPRV